MSLSGIRDLSVIETAPPDRQPILTYVGESEPTLIRAAIRREMAREGQIFFVSNRVRGIEGIAEKVRELVPDATVGVAHGQMSEHQLDEIMREFSGGKFDVLVCTVIIESGLDLPNVNTMIVEDAENFGLAQLYQLRGRVGRSDRRAYAYLLHSPGEVLSYAAGERLQTMGELTELGAGLKLALKDLEIRGAGNLLGADQHGVISEIGFELYSDLLGQEVEGLREAAEQGDLPAEVAAGIAAGFDAATLGGRRSSDDGPEIRIELPASGYIPDSYIAEELLRIEVYSEIATIAGDEGAEALRERLTDRFGTPPTEVEELVDICRLKASAARAGIERIRWERPRGIAGGRLSIYPVKVSKKSWEELRERFGRFEWHRLEKTIEYQGVKEEAALGMSIEIAEALTGLR